MATMVIKDSFFKMIDDLSTPAYVESVNQINKLNGLAIYKEMHDYVHNNIVDLDFDVDLYTEGFEWDKSKKWYENIWEFLKNLWRALINFFKAFIGKNTDFTKEEIEKLKSTAEAAKSNLESGKEISTEQLTTGLDKLDKFLDDFDDNRSKILKELQKDKGTSALKQNELLFNQLTDKFKDVKEITVWCSKNKGKLSTEIQNKLKNKINQFITIYNSSTDVDTKQKEKNNLMSRGFITILGIQMIIDSLNLLSSMDLMKIKAAKPAERQPVADYIDKIIGTYTPAVSTPTQANEKYVANNHIRRLNRIIEELISKNTEGMSCFFDGKFQVTDKSKTNTDIKFSGSSSYTFNNIQDDINKNIVEKFNGVLTNIASFGISIQSFKTLSLELDSNSNKIKIMPETPKLDTNFDADKISEFMKDATNKQNKDVTQQFLSFMKDGAEVSKEFLQASGESMKVNEAVKIFYEILKNLA